MQTFRNHLWHFAIIAVSCLSVSACASLQASDKVRAEITQAGFSNPGDTVQFTYGTKDAKTGFCPGNVVTVYRKSENGPAEIYHSRWEVGKVQIVRNVGNRKVEAKVVEGTIRTGDMALQSGGQCELKLSMLMK